MVEYIIPIATIAGVFVTGVGLFYTIKQQMNRNKLEQMARNEKQKSEIISSFQKEIEPLKVSLTKDNEAIYTNLNVKEQNIKDLWKDLESLEDHLNAVEKDVSRHSGVIDIQTPLIMEVKTQILAIKEKIDLLTQDRIKNG